MRRKIIIFCFLVIFLALLVYGFTRVGIWLVKNDHPKHADAIVMLMGSFPDRVSQTIDLYMERVSAKVIVVEPYINASHALTNRNIVSVGSAGEVFNSLVDRRVPQNNIEVLPGDTRSTQDEAVIVRDYLNRNIDLDTIILVTSSPHTRRASMIFKAALKGSKNKVTIMCSPNKYTDFNAAEWWKDKDGIRNVVSEFLKIANFLVFEKRKL